MSKKKKIRANFRKNRTPRPRGADWTKQLQGDETAGDSLAHSERVSGRGEMTRKRTLRVDDDGAAGEEGEHALDVDRSVCLAGRVLSVQGLLSTVRADDGLLYQCATRRLLKTISTELRHVVAAGDRVLLRPAPGGEGIIERVEPRHGVLSRNSRGRRHVLVANVDQLLIVGSAAEPYLKPNLIDRFLVAAEQYKIRPLIVINKVDLIDRAMLMPIVGVYAQMGYPVLLVSARTGFGVDRLQRAVRGKASAIAGQSGVGKSSLLNSIDPDLNLRVATVSAESQKGRHTTTTARLIPLALGGFVIDTPGIRQFQLWDIVSNEVAGLYRDLRPLVSQCRFPNCTHTHEAECAVKGAVADGWIDARRYESYCQMIAGDEVS